MTETPILLEVCVDSPDGLEAAIAGGADRIELCAALEIGGLTPSPGLMARAARCGRPVHAMVRGAPGGFRLTSADVEAMVEDIAAVRRAGLAGVVFGASLADGRLDAGALAVLMAAARGLDCTLHRAFDLVPDVAEAVETAVGLGFHRILTSGGAVRVSEGVARLEQAFAAAAGRITVMPGSGVTVAALPALAQLPLCEIHASCSRPLEGSPAERALGFAGPGLKQTDATRVSALKAALAALRR